MKRQYLAISAAIHLTILCFIAFRNESKSTLGNSRAINNLQISIYKKIKTNKIEPLTNTFEAMEAAPASDSNQSSERNANTVDRSKQTAG